MNSKDWKKLIEESSISQLFITAIFTVGAIVVQLVQGRIPEWLIVSVATLIGFYFGAKSNSLTNKLADTYKTAAESRGPAAGTVTTVVTTDVAPVAATHHTEVMRAPLSPDAPVASTTPSEAAANSAAGFLPAADVIEVKDGKPVTDVKAGTPVSAVIVDTKSASTSGGK